MVTEMEELELQDRNAEELVGELHALVEELERYPDTEPREKALDLVQVILELYGDALRRMLAIVDSLPLKDQLLSRLLGDEMVRAILLIHGLVPIQLHDRVQAGLNHLRPYLISQGCDVELIGIDDGRARMRLIRNGQGAPPVSVLKAEIESALAEAVPDLLGIEIDGLAQQVEATAKAAAKLASHVAPRDTAAMPSRLIQIKGPRSNETNITGPWIPIVRSLNFQEGQLKIVSQADINLLVCKIAGEFYAFPNACPAGKAQLDDALFESPMLTCSCHGYRYDLRRGGACVEKPDLRLESLPLRVEDDKVKVSLP